MDAPTRIRKALVWFGGSGSRTLRGLIAQLDGVADKLEALASLERFGAAKDEDEKDSDPKAEDVTPSRRAIDGDLDDAAEIVASVADALFEIRRELEVD